MSIIPQHSGNTDSLMQGHPAKNIAHASKPHLRLGSPHQGSTAASPGSPHCLATDRHQTSLSPARPAVVHGKWHAQESISHLAGCARGDRHHLVTLLGFGASACKLADRERLIDWDNEQRLRHLPKVINNTRFLILPWIKS